MNRSPFFSVIIPTYNRASFIEATIQSVLNQTFQDFEVIVVDDGSTDSTEEIVARFASKKIRYFKKRNEERGAARNFGVAKATSTYVTFLDSDDILYQNHLQTAFQQIQLHPHHKVFHLGYEIRNEGGQVLNQISKLGTINRALLSGNPMSCVGVFLQSQVAKENPFNEDRLLAGLEDWEAWLRIGAKYKFVAVNGITACLIEHSCRSVSSASQEKLVLKMNAFILCVKLNQQLKLAYRDKLEYVVASVYTYTALHLLIDKSSKRLALKFLVNGISHNSFEIFRRRFYVILKLLVIQ